MACTAPLMLYKRDPAMFGGVAGLTKDPRKALIGGVAGVYPCGHCIDCRLAYAGEWSVRCMHEVRVTGEGSFVTLTYDDKNLPVDWNLNYGHFQSFMHRLRKSAPGRGRFFMCGEYGDEFGRPHYHALLFGCVFSDKKYLKSVDGVDYFTSEELSRVWSHGFCTIGDISLKSAGYVARYSLKKVTGPEAGLAYQYLDQETGEVFDRDPPFCQGSLKPGIGARWFERYRSDIFPCDYVVVGGKRFPVPRYYDKLLERDDPVQWNKVRRARRAAVGALYEAEGPRDTRRLEAKARHRAAVSQQKRSLE